LKFRNNLTFLLQLIVKNTNAVRLQSITIYQRAGFTDREAIIIAKTVLFHRWPQNIAFIGQFGLFIYLFNVFIYCNLQNAGFVFALHI